MRLAVRVGSAALYARDGGVCGSAGGALCAAHAALHGAPQWSIT